MKTPEGLVSGIYGAICGSVAVMAVGFTIGGWVTRSVADDMAALAAGVSAQAVMVNVCVARSIDDPERFPVLVRIQESNSYIRAQIVQDAGWATMPWQTGPSHAVAENCANRISNQIQDRT